MFPWNCSSPGENSRKRVRGEGEQSLLSRDGNTGCREGRPLPRTKEKPAENITQLYSIDWGSESGRREANGFKVHECAGGPTALRLFVAGDVSYWEEGNKKGRGDMVMGRGSRRDGPRPE